MFKLTKCFLHIIGEVGSFLFNGLTQNCTRAIYLHGRILAGSQVLSRSGRWLASPLPGYQTTWDGPCLTTFPFPHINKMWLILLRLDSISSVSRGGFKLGDAPLVLTLENSRISTASSDWTLPHHSSSSCWTAGIARLL